MIVYILCKYTNITDNINIDYHTKIIFERLNKVCDVFDSVFVFGLY